MSVNPVTDGLPFIELYPGTNKVKSFWTGFDRIYSRNIETAPTYTPPPPDKPLSEGHVYLGTFLDKDNYMI